MNRHASEPLLACVALEAGYGAGPPVLHGVDMTVAPGEIVAVLGTNGSGKSTLAKTISKILQPSSGSVLFDGADISRIGPVAAARRGIVHVPGADGVFPSLSVADHFRITHFARKDRGHIDEGIERVLEDLPALRPRWHDRAGDLSGGEQRQLAVGIALVRPPKLLLIDELSLGLAEPVVDDLLDIVRTVRAGGCPVVIVDQSIEVAVRVADRAYFMDRGEIRFRGDPRALLERSELARPVFLAPDEPSLDTARPRLPRDAATPALSVRCLTKSFGGNAAVVDVTFEVQPGTVIGLVGSNGAGKTTVIDLVSGLVEADRGTVALGPTDITHLTARQRAELGLGRSFQEARLFPALTVAENIAVAFETHLAVRDHFASVFALPAARRVEKALAPEVDGLIQQLRLGRWRDERAGALSTGTRRLVELAMVLAHRPQVLLLDEPSAGLAQAEVGGLRSLLQQVRDDTSCSIVLVDHHLELVTDLADEMITMDRGRVIAGGGS